MRARLVAAVATSIVMLPVQWALSTPVSAQTFYLEEVDFQCNYEPAANTLTPSITLRRPAGAFRSTLIPDEDRAAVTMRLFDTGEILVDNTGAGSKSVPFGDNNDPTETDGPAVQFEALRAFGDPARPQLQPNTRYVVDVRVFDATADDTPNDMHFRHDCTTTASCVAGLPGALSCPADVAPFVVLHPNEAYYPEDQAFFASTSSLSFASRECVSHEVVSFNTPKPGLGRGDYETRERDADCISFGSTYASNQLTRPNDDDVRRVTKDEAGFHLDLPAGCRVGLAPDGSRCNGAGGSDWGANGYAGRPYTGNYQGPPVAVETSLDGRQVTYWLFYAYNWPDIVGGSIDQHEGDWERVTVQLDEEGDPQGVWYWSHDCEPGFFTWPGATAPDGVTSLGEVPLREGHPLIYVARGTHASYPWARTDIDPGDDFEGCARFVDELVNDETDEGGQWRTWLGPMIDAAAEPWYGFGGAWGEAVDGFQAGHKTGPLGPPWKNAFPTTADCGAEGEDADLFLIVSCRTDYTLDAGARTEHQQLLNDALVANPGYQKVSYASVLADPNRLALELSSCAGHEGVTQPLGGYCWDAADNSSTRWYPQGLAGSGEASWSAANVQAVSWYKRETPDDESSSTKNRVSLINTATGAYRHVQLVEPQLRLDEGCQCPVSKLVGLRIHAGGLAWAGQYLYVPDTDGGLRVFDLTQVVDTGAGNDEGKFRYRLPEIAYHEQTGADRVKFSFLSTDATTGELVSGEYNKPFDTDYSAVVHWPLNPDGTLIVDLDGRVHASSVDGAHGPITRKLQGVASAGDTYFFTKSYGHEPGNLFRVTIGGEATRYTWIVGPEDLFLDPTTGDLWSLGEHPGSRAVVGTNSANL